MLVKIFFETIKNKWKKNRIQQNIERKIKKYFQNIMRTKCISFDNKT